jgi:hypothetical protein
VWSGVLEVRRENLEKRREKREEGREKMNALREGVINKKTKNDMLKE